GSAVPEVRRAGWAIVQLCADLLPARALVGNVVGPIQTVGLAERTAALQAVRVNPDLKVFVSDLLSLVREGQSWDPELACGMQKYAGVWRSIFAHSERRIDAEPPSFVWAPAHLSIEQAFQRGCDLA
ncbi:unnamed protein product, partial [Prorocentrum cordatum]